MPVPSCASVLSPHVPLPPVPARSAGFLLPFGFTHCHAVSAPPQLEPQPFRVVVQQVEAALLDPQLPAPVLADNQQVVAVMRQFVKNLEPPGGGWPPPFRHPRVTMVFR